MFSILSLTQSRIFFLKCLYLNITNMNMIIVPLSLFIMLLIAFFNNVYQIYFMYIFTFQFLCKSLAKLPSSHINDCYSVLVLFPVLSFTSNPQSTITILKTQMWYLIPLAKIILGSLSSSRFNIKIFMSQLSIRFLVLPIISTTFILHSGVE